jgi:hypothetical protein
MSYLHSHFSNGIPDTNLNLVAEEEIISIISKLKSNNSSWYDCVTNEIIKLCRQQISKIGSFPKHVL